MPPGRPGGARIQNEGGFGLRFEVLATIATGSTARVDLCRTVGPQNPGQLIAVKRVLPDALDDEGIGKRFLDEVWMTAALRDPHVVTVVGWGQDEQGPYLASELVQGVSLARLSKSVIETGEQFPERLVVYIGWCVARGLAAAHELRSERGELLHLVHRDLSAQNVLVGFHGEVKVTDFGLAKAKDRLTVTTSELPARPMGHVAPEELEQKMLDHRADIFGFGVMLFELLSNKPPFPGKDEIAVLEAVLKKPPVDLLRLRPKMDRALAALVLRCLEKDPARRPQSTREIAHVLEEWLYVHGYLKDSQESLARFVRRNSMRQMRWFENAVARRGPAAPSPASPRQPSLYPLHEQVPVLSQEQEALTSASRATSSSLPSQTTPRDTEPTAVVGRRLIPSSDPAARRFRAPDAPVSARARRRDSSQAPAIQAPELAPTAEHEVEDDFDEIPTVAFRVDARTREELRDLQQRNAAQDTASSTALRVPFDPSRIEDSETAREQTIGELASAGARVPPAAPSPRTLAHQIDRELAGLRQLAAERHEMARIARESAHRAALAAEEAEAAARAAERAIVGARTALELVTRGDAAGAAKKIEEALAGIKR